MRALRWWRRHSQAERFELYIQVTHYSDVVLMRLDTPEGAAAPERGDRRRRLTVPRPPVTSRSTFDRSPGPGQGPVTVVPGRPPRPGSPCAAAGPRVASPDRPGGSPRWSIGRWPRRRRGRRRLRSRRAAGPRSTRPRRAPRRVTNVAGARRRGRQGPQRAGWRRGVPDDAHPAALCWEFVWTTCTAGPGPAVARPSREGAGGSAAAGRVCLGVGVMDLAVIGTPRDDLAILTAMMDSEYRAGWPSAARIGRPRVVTPRRRARRRRRASAARRASPRWSRRP